MQCTSSAKDGQHNCNYLRPVLPLFCTRCSLHLHLHLFDTSYTLDLHRFCTSFTFYTNNTPIIHLHLNGTPMLPQCPTTAKSKGYDCWTRKATGGTRKATREKRNPRARFNLQLTKSQAFNTFQYVQRGVYLFELFAKHQPGVAGCGWLQPGRNFLSAQLEQIYTYLQCIIYFLIKQTSQYQPVQMGLLNPGACSKRFRGWNSNCNEKRR